MISRGENHGRFDAEVAFLDLFDELASSGELPILQEDWFFDSESGMARLYGNLESGEYITAQIRRGKGLHVEMLNMPKNGFSAMIQVIRFAVEYNVQHIYGSAKPQKKFSRSLPRRTKLLMDFYGKFGFKKMDESTGAMCCDLTTETLSVITHSIRTRVSEVLPNHLSRFGPISRSYDAKRF